MVGVTIIALDRPLRGQPPHLGVQVLADAGLERHLLDVVVDKVRDEHVPVGVRRHAGRVAKL